LKKDPLFEVSIRMRRWDELAKEINIPLLDTHELKARAIRVLAKNTL